MATADPFILLNSISGKSRTAIYCIIMCHLETVKTYLMLKPISTAAQYCLLLVACNVWLLSIQNILNHIPETWVESKATKTPQ